MLNVVNALQQIIITANCRRAENSWRNENLGGKDQPLLSRSIGYTCLQSCLTPSATDPNRNPT